MNSIRLSSFKRGEQVAIEVDGQEIVAYQGETVATAFLASGINTFYTSIEVFNAPNRLFCGMGVCMQCLVTINGQTSHKACQTMVQTGMKVETHDDTESV
jgi:predicted molibdopterin-dependent oxidoreductase YjgC